MTDRRASLDSHSRRLQRHSPAPDAPPLHSGSLHSSSTPRKRSVRAASIPNDSTGLPSSPWVDANKGESRKPKGAAWKAHGGRSRSSSTSPARETEPSEEEKDSFLPKLSRIAEGKETRTSTRRRSLPVGARTASVPAPQYQEPTQAAPPAPRTIRRKQGSLQRLADGGVDLSNPSLVSVLSGRTQQSGTSSGSNSTATQQIPTRSQSFKQRAAKELRRLRSPIVQTDTMDNSPSAVFQYMNEELVSDQFLESKPNNDRPASSSSAGSTNADHDDGGSSDGEESLADSPMTSPASARLSNASALGNLARWNNSGPHYAPVASTDSDSSDDECDSNYHDSNAPNQPSVQEEGEESEGHGEEPEAEVESQTGEVEDANTDDETTDSCTGVDEAIHQSESRDSSPASTEHLAVERIPPPRLPSTSSSRHSDRHTRRLRTQEQELRDHVLQSPQPHRGFDFAVAGGVSPSPHPSMMYDSYSNSDGSPPNMYAPASQPPTWAPPAPIPPMGYYSPTHAPPVPPAPYGFSPENSYAMTTRSPMAPPSTMAHHPPSYGHPHPPYYQQQEAVGDIAKTTVVGYELLADKLTELSHNEKGEQVEGKILPMYRKFEQLNHRVLLHLQDEISELEEELRYLDECIARASPPEESHHRHTASRRNEARYGGELHYRRTELLGRVYLKLGQYNQALSSFSNMLKDLDSPNMDQVQVYRSWMERHAPVERSEAQFLDRKHDLVAVPRRGSATTVGGVNPHQSAAMGLPLIALIPLMLFAIVPGFLGRLFIIAVIGAAEVSVVTSTELMDLMAVREWVICASGYFGLMAILAGLVH